MRNPAVPLCLALVLVSASAFGDRDAINLGAPPLPAANDGLVRTLSPEALAPGAFRANVWLGYERSPLVLRHSNGVEFPIVRDRVFNDYALSLGVLPRLEVSFALGAIPYESGVDISETIDRAPIPATALGNMEVGYKTTWLTPGDLGGMTLGSRGVLEIPTGSRSALRSSGSPEGELLLLSGLHLLVFELRASAGVRLRGAEPSFLQVRYGDEFRWNAGLMFRPVLLGWDATGATRIGLEFSSAEALSGDAPSGATGAQIRLGVSRRIGVLSINTGLQLPLDSRPGNPRVMGFVGLGWSSDE